MLTEVEIPQWWGKAYEEEKQTRTALNNKRRKERIPDLSFDLDGDGLVGNRDFVIAKLFDADKDGKLNEQERKAALDALNSVSAGKGVLILSQQGHEDKFVWGIEQSGAHRAYRILQKVGSSLILHSELKTDLRFFLEYSEERFATLMTSRKWLTPTQSIQFRAICRRTRRWLR